jgi:septal ring factor EnvC (AmiA/AmiB activator)
MTRKDRKSKMSLEKLARLTQQGFLGLDKRLVKVEFELREVKTEIREAKTDIKRMKENSSELFTKLDKFISLYERQEQEFSVLGAQLRRLEERVAALEKSR